MRMKDRAGLISAGGSGMGRAGALRIAAEGAKVAVIDRDAAAANETVETIKAAGGTAIALVGDLRSDDFAAEIVAKTAEAFGGIDYLWNHVGVPGPSAIDELDMADYEFAMDLNIRSGVVTTKAALPFLTKAKGAAILFTASTSGLVGSPLSPIYSATKFGQIGLMRSLAKRYGPMGVRVNCVAPGAVDTPMLREFYARSDSKEKTDDVEGKIAARATAFPLGRIAQPEDIANAALFLLSDEASYISGHVLVVDGAMHA